MDEIDITVEDYEAFVKIVPVNEGHNVVITIPTVTLRSAEQILEDIGTKLVRSSLEGA